MTFEEFVQHADAFARDNHEPGTLTLRQLQRLVSGRHPGALRPALRGCLQVPVGIAGTDAPADPA